MRTFHVSVDERPGRTVVTLAGELDVDTCPRVTRVTDTVPLPGRTLSLDLSGISFMDSSSLNMLLVLLRRAEAEKGALELCGVQDQARRLLELTGAGGLFNIRPALAA
ncbi:STAS domain-containing protein [Streptomyces sp. NPDC047980]|uniref:STAS domain-containing protein n=1 Tax=Streptomyces sp. NPDC047980 TaxID=3365494 RepID=UPI0037230D8E